jgi:hypothetical protein
MVINLSKGDQSRASNQVQSISCYCGTLKEDETVRQLPEKEEIVKVDTDSATAA